MEEVRAYKSFDGKIFGSEIEAARHEDQVTTNEISSIAFDEALKDGKVGENEELATYDISGYESAKDAICPSPKNPIGYHMYYWESTTYDRKTNCACCGTHLSSQPWN